MDKLFGGLSKLIKLDNIVIDNHMFRLHYKFTVALLIAFSLVVTSRQYIGDPIDCISRDDIPTNLLDTFCWIHSTFSVISAWNKTVGIEVPYPGITQFTPNEPRVYHKYYQWVCFVLFLQAILFYVPRYIWKIAEGNRVQALVMELDSPILSEEKKNDRRKVLVNYLVTNMHQHGCYACQYFFCEILLFINVIGQMYMMNAFLGGEFLMYGLKVIQFTDWEPSLRFDPMIKVFPRLTKCTFYRYGSSGDIQKYDAMCILPINIINEKIYVLLWFWFMALAVITSIVLAYRTVLFTSKNCRDFVLRSRARLTSAEKLQMVLNHCEIGDWFLMDLLCKNIEPMNYRDLIADFAKKLEPEMSKKSAKYELV